MKAGRSREQPVPTAVHSKSCRRKSRIERFFGRRTICVFATVVFTCACVGGVSLYRDRLLINVSGSVPLGLYFKSDPSVAEFATICLPELPVWVGYDSILCSADNPSGIPVIKRIVAKVDRGIILRGDGTLPLDSRVFGPVSPERILGFWRPVVTLSFLSRIDVREPVGASRNVVRNISSGSRDRQFPEPRFTSREPSTPPRHGPTTKGCGSTSSSPPPEPPAVCRNGEKGSSSRPSSAVMTPTGPETWPP